MDFHYKLNERPQTLSNNKLKKSSWYLNQLQWIACDDVVFWTETQFKLMAQQREDDLRQQFLSKESSIDESACHVIESEDSESDASCCVCNDSFMKHWSNDLDAWVYLDCHKVSNDTIKEYTQSGDDDEMAEHIGKVMTMDILTHLGKLAHIKCIKQVLNPTINVDEPPLLM